VETANPVRSVKGRGADFLMGQFDAGQTVVCSSTGNFGQAMAYTGRRRGVAVEVFVPENVNPVKLARMRSFGARVTAVGADSAASEAAARERVAAGLHVLIELAAGVDERAVVDAAARRSIRVYGGGAYHAKPLAGPPVILVGYGGLPESTIPEAVRELAQVLMECSQSV
jgi:threonine dehydratase